MCSMNQRKAPERKYIRQKVSKRKYSKESIRKKVSERYCKTTFEVEKCTVTSALKF